MTVDDPYVTLDFCNGLRSVTIVFLMRHEPGWPLLAQICEQCIMVSSAFFFLPNFVFVHCFKQFDPWLTNWTLKVTDKNGAFATTTMPKLKSYWNLALEWYFLGLWPVVSIYLIFDHVMNTNFLVNSLHTYLNSTFELTMTVTWTLTSWSELDILMTSTFMT